MIPRKPELPIDVRQRLIRFAEPPVTIPDSYVSPELLEWLSIFAIAARKESQGEAERGGVPHRAVPRHLNNLLQRQERLADELVAGEHHGAAVGTKLEHLKLIRRWS